MIGDWMRQGMEGLVSVFSGKAEAKEGIRGEELERLHAKIGQLVVERDFLSQGLRSMSVEQRRGLIDPGHGPLSIGRQCALVSISRPSFYHRPGGETVETLALMRLIDAQFLETPWYGSRQMMRHLRRDGHEVGRKRVRRLMSRMGLVPIHQRPRTTVPHPEHRIYRYLLRDLVVSRPNQVWCADLTYIPIRRGFLYLVAVMDGATRKVLAWRVSNTMDVGFCVEALQEALGRRRWAGGVGQEALARFGRPEIFNTDQGSQFTSADFTDVLRGAQVRISMDGRGRWMGNVFIERLWRSLKYECVSLHAFETGSELWAGLTRWIGYYNARRPHSTLGGRTPDEAYGIDTVAELAA